MFGPGRGDGGGLGFSYTNHASGQVFKISNQSEKRCGYSVVKVQIPLDKGQQKGKGDMLLYNKVSNVHELYS